MTKEEFKNRYTVISRDDIYKALVDEGLLPRRKGDEGLLPRRKGDEGLLPKGETLDSIDFFLYYIGFPTEGIVAYYKDEVADAKDWILNWDDIFLGWFEHKGNPDETFGGYLETMHGLSFREHCTGTDELEDGQWFCEKVADDSGQMEIRRYWIRCASDTFADSAAGELCSYLMLDGYVFDEYDWRFGALESFLNVEEILKLVKED